MSLAHIRIMDLLKKSCFYESRSCSYNGSSEKVFFVCSYSYNGSSKKSLAFLTTRIRIMDRLKSHRFWDSFILAALVCTESPHSSLMLSWNISFRYFNCDLLLPKHPLDCRHIFSCHFVILFLSMFYM